MIIPAGNRKQQINQGDCQNSIFYDQELFGKIAVDLSGIRNLEDEQVPTPVDPQLQGAMNGSATLAPPPEQEVPMGNNGMAGTEQPAEEMAQEGSFETNVNAVVQQILDGLDIRPGQWNVKTSNEVNGGVMNSITIHMTKNPNVEAAKPVAKA